MSDTTSDPEHPFYNPKTGRLDREHEQDPCNPPTDPIVFRQPYTVEAQYDPDKGELSFIDERVTQVLQVRRQFEEMATRKAAIIELERLGYTIIAPVEAMRDCLYGCKPDGDHHPACPNLTKNQEPTE